MNLSPRNDEGWISLASFAFLLTIPGLALAFVCIFLIVAM